MTYIDDYSAKINEQKINSMLRQKDVDLNTFNEKSLKTRNAVFNEMQVRGFFDDYEPYEYEGVRDCISVPVLRSPLRKNSTIDERDYADNFLLLPQHWTLNTIEHTELFFAVKRRKFYHLDKDVITWVYFPMAGIFAKISKGDKNVFMNLIKQYNYMQNIEIQKTTSTTEIEKLFLKGYDLSIPLELFFNIHFTAGQEKETIYVKDAVDKLYTVKTMYEDKAGNGKNNIVSLNNM